MADQDSKMRLDPEQIDVDTLEVEELDQVAGGLAPTDTCPIENWQCTATCPPPPPATSVAAE